MEGRLHEDAIVNVVVYGRNIALHDGDQVFMRLDEFTNAVVGRDGASAIVRVLEVAQELAMGEILEDEAEAGSVAHGIIVIEGLRSSGGEKERGERTGRLRLARGELQMR